MVSEGMMKLQSPSAAGFRQPLHFAVVVGACLVCAATVGTSAFDSGSLAAQDPPPTADPAAVADAETILKPPPPTFAQRAYRVQVCLFADPQTTALTGGATELSHQIQSTVASYARSPWTFPFAAEATTTPGLGSLHRLSATSLIADWPDHRADKVLFIEISRVGQSIRCAVREWDCFLQSLGNLQSARLNDDREVITFVSAMAVRGLRRVVEIETRRGGVTILRGRGSQLSVADATDNSPAVGQKSVLFQPYYRFLNKEGIVDRVSAVPWTYIAADPALNEFDNVRIISGLRQALSGRRRRVHVYGLEVPVQKEHAATTVARLQLVSLRNRQQPVVGLEVDVFGDGIASLEKPANVSHSDSAVAAAGLPDANQQSPDANQRPGISNATQASAQGEQPAGRDADSAALSHAADSAEAKPVAPKRLASLLSDRSGTLRIDESQFSEQFPLYWLMIRRGRHPLARVPVVLAVAGEARLEISDDSLRSQAAIDLSLLESELIDAVARRAIVMARCRLQMRSGNLEAARSILKELDILPDAARFQAQLESIRLPAIELARTQRDRSAEAAIRKLCEDTSSVIAAYLSDDKRRSLVEEIQELEAAKRADAAPRRPKAVDDPEPAEKQAPQAPLPKAPPPKANPVGF